MTRRPMLSVPAHRRLARLRAMTYTPENLNLWARPDYYAGAEWPDYYVFLAQHRDSDSLTRSNFVCGLRAVGGESETVRVVCEGHWAVGYVEWIAIHKSDANALQEADEIAAALQDYPVVDESHWSALEEEEAQTFWAESSLGTRVDLCRTAHISRFAARREHYADADPDGSLFELLREI